MVAYLLAGMLHGLCDIDVTNPSGKSVSGNGVIAMSAVKDPDASGKGMAAEHHCHGCFSVSAPTLPQVSDRTEPTIAARQQPRSEGSDLVPGIDTPPPKFLT